MKIKGLILCLLVAGLGWAWSGAAQATEVTLHFTGQILPSSTLDDPAFAAGTTYAGDLTYDLSATDGLRADPSLGIYSGTSLTVSFSTGATVTCVGQPSIFVEDNRESADSFKMTCSNLAVTGSSLQLTLAGLILTDDHQTAFTTDSLPASFNLNDFGRRVFTLWWGGQTHELLTAEGTITSITFNQAVPLPASILLFGTALGGWLAAGTIRRSKRLL